MFNMFETEVSAPMTASNDHNAIMALPRFVNAHCILNHDMAAARFLHGLTFDSERGWICPNTSVPAMTCRKPCLKPIGASIKAYAAQFPRTGFPVALVPYCNNLIGAEQWDYIPAGHEFDAHAGSVLTADEIAALTSMDADELRTHAALWTVYGD